MEENCSFVIKCIKSMQVGKYFYSTHRFYKTKKANKTYYSTSINSKSKIKGSYFLINMSALQ